ncbi:cutinase family protein [Gordonia crocea]|uniref:PE-PPE domain-containing protein n=1 Tax=Gordonia crocea TaxID=589162 RepID=A0A7I9UWH4_9ACTN|nr:cutinase family protein [Gordonia crocea]GED97292.1 hypothetical protein nbrc107697_13310 [Gordonia crocea]
MRERRGRRLTALTIAAIASGLALCASLLVPSGGAHAAECSASGAVIMVPGTNDRENNSMTALVTGDKYKDYDQVRVGYSTNLWPLGGVGYDKDAQLGKTATIEAVKEYRSKCGEDAKVTIIGYSQGARIAGDALSDIGNGRADGVSAENVEGVLYSDPRQEGISGFFGRGIELSFLGVIPGITMSGSREGGFGVLNDHVTSLCSQGDGICYLADPLKDPLGALDSLVGYALKHGDYPLKGWMADESWAVDGAQPSGAEGQTVCEQAANNGGTVCIVQRVSSVTLAIREIAKLVGMEDPSAIPDVYGKVGNVLNLNNVLPGATISDLQPIFDIINGALPQLPYVTYNVGGYLPDILTAGELIGGVVTIATGGNSTQLRNAVNAIGRSAISLMLIPVNATVYWGNKLGLDLPTQTLGLGFVPGEDLSNYPTLWPDGWDGFTPYQPPGNGQSATLLAGVQAAQQGIGQQVVGQQGVGQQGFAQRSVVVPQTAGSTNTPAQQNSPAQQNTPAQRFGQWDYRHQQPQSPPSSAQIPPWQTPTGQTPAGQTPPRQDKGGGGEAPWSGAPDSDGGAGAGGRGGFGSRFGSPSARQGGAGFGTAPAPRASSSPAG